MRTALIGALMLGALSWTAPAAAQQASITQTIAGTRLDINASGEVTRVPDIAIISAGVVTRSATATGALQDAAERMQRVSAALKRAGIEDRDIQTSNVNLSPEYRYPENQSPQLTGYTASNQLTIRFHDIRNSGKILDVLVAEGANQINGPNLTIEHPEAALDEARALRARPRAACGPRCRRIGERRLRGSPGAAPTADDGADGRCPDADRARRAEARGQRRDDLRAAVTSILPSISRGGDRRRRWRGLRKRLEDPSTSYAGPPPLQMQGG
jgi:uncharacterized protein YggE